MRQCDSHLDCRAREDPLELWDWVRRAKSFADLFIRTLRLTQINMNCDGIATFFKSFVEAPMSSLDRQILA
jgi:hypothetical protein